MNNKGLVHIYTGDGKGKTTASLGLIMRAIGSFKKVLFVQFLKGQDTGEIYTLEKLGVDTIRTQDVLKFVPFMNENEKKVCQLNHQMCYNKMKCELNSNNYDIIVLDEIIPCIDLNIFLLKDIIYLINNKPFNVELVLTGRNAPQELIEIADYVSNINCVKHPYNDGVKARKGIEY